jgi:radical SAM/Cys-rich protein
MHATLPLLRKMDFPASRRRQFNTLQVNLGYRCNQTCQHCHVNAGPNCKEMMDAATVELVLQVLKDRRLSTLNLTGGAPKLSPHFRRLARDARRLGIRAIDRCNLTVLFEPGQEDLADFLAENEVEITASLPCYSKDNVDKQRGDGVFTKSITALQKLNALGCRSCTISISRRIWLICRRSGESLCILGLIRSSGQVSTGREPWQGAA